VKNKKILVNTFPLKDGGGQTHILKIIEYLNEKNLEVIILKSRFSDLKFKKSKAKLYETIFPVNNPLLRAFYEIFYIPILLVKNRVDVFFCPGGISISWTPKNCKKVTMFRNMQPFIKELVRNETSLFKKIRIFLIKFLMIKSFKDSDLVIFISNYAQEVIKKNLKKPLKKTVLINHGVDMNDSKTHHEFSKISNFKEPFIIYPSSIESYKSQMEVIMAYSLASEKLVQELPNLYLVGSINNKKYFQDLKKQIKRFNLENKIFFTGKIEYHHMPTVYKNSLMVIFASKIENCPNILLEAIAMNKLILCSNIKPMPEFGKDSVIYFNPNSPVDLSRKLIEILSEKTIIKLYQEKTKNTKIPSWKDCANRTWKELGSI
jgi:glycosyltransferase involved in cell wall biosynthesis